MSKFVIDVYSADQFLGPGSMDVHDDRESAEAQCEKLKSRCTRPEQWGLDYRVREVPDADY